jgi:uncharacterized protein
MPKDYDPAVTAPNAQRRPQNALDDETTRALLETLEIGHVATAWDGQPFINPTTFWYDAATHTLYFHSNVVGRMRANSEHHDRVCFEASRFGRFLPSNIALEFSVQYESVVVYGTVRVVDDLDQKRAAMAGLLAKYFPKLRSGAEYRPITDGELKRTSVYALAIESWGGKRNWAERADQSNEWAPLGEARLK